MKPAVVVTGASTGIGAATLHHLVSKGFHVFGSVRKDADAVAMRAAYGNDVTPLLFDVTDHAALARAAREVANTLGNATLRGLVNNAGIAVAGPLMHVALDEVRHQFEVNVIGAIAVTQAFLPLLGARPKFAGKPGRIVMMSSVSGRLGFPFLGPYVASKHALEGLSDALRRELLIYGIDVIVLEPGSIATPIWDKADKADRSKYAHTDYAPILDGVAELMINHGREGLPASVVAKAVHAALTAKRPKPRVALVAGRFANWTVPTMLPQRWLDRLMGGRLGLLKRDDGPNGPHM